ncbi:PilZ domain-containing protein [Pseudomonas sp. MWU12-2323]|uniref:PilZ domain-containing protein n=1 Tax=Pseudomonas sp. MWU12-2323 TaxID=2651296 RepID=UPI00128C0C79|nr:PilZ domain-containing protein [Pseudomonas sp. MWU12-2323]MPQ69318.1 PilZ domain-containing protein [Pseudomonas sp. MWU12-2323]
MSESERRFQRYALTPSAFSRQRVKALGFIGSLRGWKECRVKDMSTAGALLLSKQEHYLGDKIEVELQTVEGRTMVFKGEVVNLGRDHATSQHRVGVRLETPEHGTSEAQFLDGLQTRFKESA